MLRDEAWLPFGSHDVSVLSGDPPEGVKERGAEGGWGVPAPGSRAEMRPGVQLPGFLIWLWLRSAMCLGSLRSLSVRWRSDLQRSAKS